MVKSICLLENEPIKTVEWAKMTPEGRVLVAALWHEGRGVRPATGYRYNCPTDNLALTACGNISPEVPFVV